MIPAGPAAAADVTHAFAPVPPARLLDTRDGTTKPGVASVTEVTVGGRAGVPADAAAAVLNVTATESSGAGYLTAYPAGSSRPPTSFLNLDAANQTRAVQVTVALSGGNVSLYSQTGTHLVVDVAGYYSPAVSSTAGRLLTTSPTRILDTRRNGERPAANTSVTLPVTGVAGVPSNASAIVANLTATDAAAPGFVTVSQSGIARPLASNLNLDAAGATVANLVTVPVGVGGSVELYTQAGTHLIVDVLGYYTGTGSPVGTRGLFVPAAARVLDTRGGAMPAGGTDTNLVLGTASAGSAALLGAVATEATLSGFVSVFPQAVGFRNTSNLNYGPNATVANSVLVANDGGAQIRALTATHLVVDLAGWFT